MKKVYTLLGGAGFVGGHLTKKLLDSGHKVIVIDAFTYAGSMDHLAEAMASYKWKLVQRFLEDFKEIKDNELIVARGDIRDATLMANVFMTSDGVINLAAESHVDGSYLTPTMFTSVNVTGLQTILEAKRLVGRRSARLLHFSTDEVYGEVLKGTAKEFMPMNPRNNYAASKAQGDFMIDCYRRIYEMDIVTVRPCNMFGPYQQPKDLLPKTFAYFLNNHKMTVHGDGKHIREYLYVKDAAAIVEKIFEKGKSGEIYNIASHDFHDTLDVVGQVAKVLNKKPIENWLTFEPDRPNPDRRYAGDNAKMRKLIGPFKFTSFDTALKAMADDFIRRGLKILA